MVLPTSSTCIHLIELHCICILEGHWLMDGAARSLQWWRDLRAAVQCGCLETQTSKRLDTLLILSSFYSSLPSFLPAYLLCFLPYCLSPCLPSFLSPLLFSFIRQSLSTLATPKKPPTSSPIPLTHTNPHHTMLLCYSAGWQGRCREGLAGQWRLPLLLDSADGAELQ